MNLMQIIASILPGSVYILVSFLVLGFIARFSISFVLKPIFKHTKTRVDDRVINIIKNPVFVSFLVAGFYYYLDTLSFSEDTLESWHKTLISFAVFVWSYTVIKIAEIIYEEIEIKHGKHSDAIPFLNNLTRFGIGIAALTILLNVWGVDIAPILASAGFAGLGLAFAAKDTISNLFGGISIFFDKPYRIGDYVIIDKEFRGEVIDIGMRSTKIRTRDNVLITVPNSVMVTQAVINETGFDPKLRVRLPIGVSYNSDLEKIEMVIITTLKQHKNIIEDPSPIVRYRNFGDSSINLEALFTVEPPAKKGIVTHEVVKSIYQAFEEEKIIIPHPQLDVTLKKE